MYRRGQGLGCGWRDGLQGLVDGRSLMGGEQGWRWMFRKRLHCGKELLWCWAWCRGGGNWGARTWIWLSSAGRGGGTWWGLGALVARGAANRGREVLSKFRVRRSGDCGSGDKVDVLPALVRLLVCCGSKAG